MLLTISVAIAVLLVALAGIAIIGRVSLIKAIEDNRRLVATVNEFHSSLVAYANSNGNDQLAFRRLTMKSTAVEGALGWDNIVTGVQIGMYTLNNAHMLPLAIQEMRREYNDGFSWGSRGETADVVQTVLFRHIGRRQRRDELLVAEAQSFASCVAVGWTTLTALPISILSAFGLLNANWASAARQSFLFRLWNLLLAIAAISAPILAYLADREKIDVTLRALIPW